MYKPAFEKAAEQVDATFVEVDVDAVPEVVVEYGVQGVPATHQYKDGERVKTLVGAQRLIPLIAELSA
jgi:thiol-disulfide isomerase/thioredoxin